MEEKTKLQLTAWGEFVTRYSVMVPRELWGHLRGYLNGHLNLGNDWKFFAEELIAGLQALMDDEGQDSLHRIVALEEEEEKRGVNHNLYFRCRCALTMFCGRCKKEIAIEEAETCWYCQAPLCYECWNKHGHCGHPEAEAMQAMIQKGEDDGP